MHNVILFLLLIFVGCGTTMMVPEVDRKAAEEEAYQQRVLAWKKSEGYTKRLADVEFPVLRANVR